MLKNFKILKGITLALALVLLVGGGILLKNYADAAASTVIYYLSDSGDNTTGADEATAFHSIDTAIQAANERKLAPGTKLKLIVVDRLTVETQTVDSIIAVDSEGNRLPVIITSLEGTSKDDFSVLYMAFINGNANSSAQQAIFKNDITFKNLSIISKVHDAYVQFNPANKRSSQKNFYLQGNNTTFENVYMAPERTGDDVDVMLMYLDNGTTEAIERNVTIKDCDFYNLTVYSHNATAPNMRLTVNLENSRFNDFHLTSLTATATTDDMKKLTLNVNAGAYINRIMLANKGHIDIPEGITVNFYPDSTIGSKGMVGNSASYTGTIASDLTYNYYGGTFNGDMFSGSYGAVSGDIVNNIYEGATFNKSFFGGGYGIRSGQSESRVNHTGSITNNVYGGTFNGKFYGGPSSKGSKFSTITNNVTGGTFNSNFFGGGGTATGDTVTNNISGAQFATTYYSGNESGDCDTIVSNLTDVTTAKEFYGGCKSGDCVNITNNLKNTTVGSEYYGGVGGGSVVNITNNLHEGTVVNTRMYGGNGGSSGAPLTGTLTNNFYGGTYNSTVYASGRYGPVSAIVYTNIYDGQFTGTVYGGLRQPGNENQYVNTIVSAISGGNFAGGFVGGNSDSGNVTGSITTTVNGGTFGGNFVGGSTAGDVIGVIVSTIGGGTFKEDIIGASSKNGTASGGASLVLAPSGSAVPLCIEGTVPAATGLTTKLVGGSSALQIADNSAIFADVVEGELLVSQNVSWTADQVYVTFSSAVDADKIQAVNASGSVSGSGVFDGTVLKGSSSGAAVTAPALSNMVSFLLDDNLGVRFWILKDDVNDYIEETGSWSYAVFLGDVKVSEASFSQVDAFPADDVKSYEGNDYFTFTAGLGVSSTEYGEEIRIVLGGADAANFTVYELLESGIELNSSDVELVNLLKAIHNYGVEAYNVFEGASESKMYDDVTYTGNYSGAPSFSRLEGQRGYSLYQTSMSLDEAVSLNFYLKTPSAASFKAVNCATSAELDTSRIIVKEVTGNENYNYVVSIRLTVPEMKDAYALKVYSGSTEVASATNGIGYCCAAYISSTDAEMAKYAQVSEALLTYIEASQAYLVSHP